MAKRTIERLAKARRAGRSFRDIERRMAGTLRIVPGNGTAAMRACRRAGIK